MKPFSDQYLRLRDSSPNNRKDLRGGARSGTARQTRLKLDQDPNIKLDGAVAVVALCYRAWLVT